MNYYKECIKTLNELHKDHPHFSMGRHLSTALSEYGDSWGMPDKEMLYALQKYQTELEVDPTHTVDDDYVDKIIFDSQDLDHILDEEEE